MGSGQQCCYGQDDNLIVGPGSGGSVDLFAPNGIINKARHFYEDVRPFIYCCKGHRASSTCQMYYDKRPSDDGTRYNPPPPGNLNTVVSEKIFSNKRRVKMLCMLDILLALLHTNYKLSI